MIHFCGSIDFLYICDRLQGGVIGLVICSQRNLLEILHGHVGNLLIEVLHSEHVVIAGFRVDPVARRNHAI